MSNQPRQTKVFAALAASMTALAFVLMSLGYNPPAAGAFCLSSYNRMLPVRQAIYSLNGVELADWDGIEISVISGNGNNKKLFDKCQATGHFIICNGQIGTDGRIELTPRWLKQQAVADQNSQDSIIHIIVLAGADTAGPTGFQVRRTLALVELLQRKFGIAATETTYPGQFLF